MTRWFFFGAVLAMFVGAAPVLSFHVKGDREPHYIVGYPILDAKGRCWVQQVVAVPGSRLLSVLPAEQWKGSRVFCLSHFTKEKRRTP